MERHADASLLVTRTNRSGVSESADRSRLPLGKRIPGTCLHREARTRAEWRRLNYAQVWQGIRAVGEALLQFDLSAERPVMILSENDLEQFVLTLAGQHVGIPVAPISPPYSLVSKDLGRLRHIANLLTPGLIFAADGERFERAVGNRLQRYTRRGHAFSTAGQTSNSFLRIASNSAFAES